MTVAWFTFDTMAYPAETRLSGDGLTATTDSYEPRVLLSSVGFSRGVHYWEFTIDRYDGAADPAFGVARRDVTRDAMLGNNGTNKSTSLIMHGGRVMRPRYPSVLGCNMDAKNLMN